MRLLLLYLSGSILLTACRTSKDELLRHKINYLEWKHHYTINYGVQKISFSNTFIDKENVASISINHRKREITIVPIKKEIEYVYVAYVLDSARTMTGKKNFLMIYRGVPYTSQLMDYFDITTFRIEKSIYEGFITYNSIEEVESREAKSGKIIFLLH